MSWIIWIIAALFASVLAWACTGRLDRLAVAPGRLVAPSALQIVQPSEAGIVSQFLVREGQEVARGEVLLRLDPSFVEADRRAASESLARSGLQLRRIEAELRNDALVRQPADAEPLFAQVHAQWQENRRLHRATLSQHRTLIARAVQDRAAARSAAGGLRASLQILVAQDEAWTRLAAEGFAGRLLALERSRLRVERQGELDEQLQRLEGLEAAVQEARHRYAQIESGYRASLQRERAELLAQRERLVQEDAKQVRRAKLLELTAPMAGRVKDLSTHTAGAVVQPGAVLMTLVPRESHLVAEVLLRNEDAPQVRAGLPARVKVAAYPFQRFGLLQGEVESVAPDAFDARSDAPQAGTAMAAAGNMAPPGYRARIRLDQTAFRSGETAHPLQPGLSAQAEIVLGHRSILDYLLSPLQGIAAEAGRER